MSKAEFDDLTPAEFYALVEAYNERRKEEAEQERQKAYLSASLVAVFVGKAFGGKRLPRYDELFPEEAGEEMNDDKMFQQVRALNALFGGKDK